MNSNQDNLKNEIVFINLKYVESFVGCKWLQNDVRYKKSGTNIHTSVMSNSVKWSWKKSAFHSKVTESGTSSYDKWYNCELFYLFNTMNPKFSTE